MITPTERIRDLVRKGALPPSEGETLLAALARAKQPHAFRLFMDPFARFDALRLALLGLGASLVGIALAARGVRFDGLLDLHITAQAWPLRVAVADAFVAWPLGALMLWLASLASARQGRFIDFLSVVGVARLPMVASGLGLVALASAGALPRLSPETAAPGLGILAHVTIALLGVAWNLRLQYVGFGTASGLRGGKRSLTFILTVFISELVSKYLLLQS